MNYFWLCRFCMSETEGTEDHRDEPQECPHCHVTACDDCGTFLKGKPPICYGCGRVSPLCRASMIRSDRFGACYAEAAWRKRNNHRSGEGEFELLVSSSARVVKRTERDGKWVSEDVRVLTEEERSKLNPGMGTVLEVVDVSKPGALVKEFEVKE